MGSTDTVNLRMLACPADGTILDRTHSCGDGRYECPKCNSRWESYEVTQ